jgi:hypothetical protein
VTATINGAVSPINLPPRFLLLNLLFAIAVPFF